jgi:hypothetical protein
MDVAVIRGLLAAGSVERSVGAGFSEKMVFGLLT